MSKNIYGTISESVFGQIVLSLLIITVRHRGMINIEIFKDCFILSSFFMSTIILSRVPDYKINAINILIELSIKDYLSIANQIIDKNEMQRKKVKSSKSVYSLLRHDLRQGCTIPPIFLAIRKEAIDKDKDKSIQQLLAIKDESILKYIEEKKLLILDGLQRTYQMLELESELKKERDKQALETFYNQRIRAEVFLGINKIGILYRMLTLNTGQTPMSIRHQIEILYQDYLGKDKVDGIDLLKEIDVRQQVKMGSYKFNEIIDGFQSYIEKDELAIDKTSLLEDVKTIEKLSKIGQQKDLFKSFVVCYHSFIVNIHKIGSDWNFDDNEDLQDKIDQPFGVNVESVFIRSQVITGFGAAIGSLEDAEKVKDIDFITKELKKIKVGGDIDDTFESLITYLEAIRKTSKKIGNSQRRYFYFFFKALLNPEADSYLNIRKSVEKAYQNYKVEFL